MVNSYQPFAAISLWAENHRGRENGGRDRAREREKEKERERETYIYGHISHKTREKEGHAKRAEDRHVQRQTISVSRYRGTPFSTHQVALRLDELGARKERPAARSSRRAPTCPPPQTGVRNRTADDEP